MKTVWVGNKLYIFLLLFFVMIAISLFFKISLPEHPKQLRPDIRLSNRTRQTTHCNHDVVISRERFGDAYIVYTYSNTANLGVRRTQETALPTDRVVFIMKARTKKTTLSPPPPVTIVANELST